MGEALATSPMKCSDIWGTEFEMLFCAEAHINIVRGLCDPSGSTRETKSSRDGQTLTIR